MHRTLANCRKKPRAPMGELRNFSHEAREKLHGWFREDQGTIPYKEIAKRLKTEFGISAGLSTLSDYYRQKHAEILAGSKADAEVATICPAATIAIRIEVPRGCRVDIATQEGGARQ